MSTYIHKSHNVTVLLYHLVFPAKYRRAVVDASVDEVLRDVCPDIEKRYEIKFLEIRYGQGSRSFSGSVCADVFCPPRDPDHTNSAETDRSSLILKIASPSKGATLRRSMLRAWRTRSVGWMVSVMTRPSSADESIRSTARPESTP